MCVDCDFILGALENTLVLKRFGLEYVRVKHLNACNLLPSGSGGKRKCVGLRVCEHAQRVREQLWQKVNTGDTR